MKALPFLFLMCAASAWAVDPVAISATQRTAEKVKGETRDLRGGTARQVTKTVLVEFKIKAQVAGLSQATAEWTIFKRNLLNRLTVTAAGREDLQLRPGHIVTFNSDEVELAGAEISGVRGKGGRTVRGGIAESIEGYAIVVKSPAGQVLGTKYSSSDIEREMTRIEEAVDRRQSRPRGKR